MTERTIARIVRLYGEEPLRIHSPQKGYRNQSWRVETERQDVNVIIYKQEAGILDRMRRADRVAAYLFGCGFPTRVPIDQRIVRLSGGTKEQFARVYNYLPGATIPWEAYTMEHIKLLGKTMSNMHAALADYNANDLQQTAGVAEEYLEVVRRMGQYFANPAIVKALHGTLDLRTNPDIISNFESLLTVCKRLTHKQALHMDFVRSNILFDTHPKAPQLTGILDLEKAAYGHPTIDIARTLAFLLIDCKYKEAVQIRKYFLWSGYHKRGSAPYKSIRVNGKNLLDQLIDLFMYYDFYKFLKHNPYEYLPQNEHFVKTRDLLLANGLLERT